MLTAYQLEVSEEALAAIVDVRDRLDRGELIHVPLEVMRGCGQKPVKLPDNGFSMRVWDNEDCMVSSYVECGTVGCIGGWVQKLHGISLREVDEPLSDGLDELIYPPLSDWGSITTADTVKAIDNWRETGRPRWDSICPGHKSRILFPRVL